MKRRRFFAADEFRFSDCRRVRLGFAFGCATDSAQFGCG